MFEHYISSIDGGGHIRLVDFMGEDSSVPQAARVSYGKGTKTVLEDNNLIRFLMRRAHFSPFSMVQVKLHVRTPLFINSQWLRHDRMHWNLLSARYSVMPEDCWEPAPEDIRGQGTGNKQVGNGKLDSEVTTEASKLIAASNTNQKFVYDTLLNMGVCREQARTVLPVGQYTEGYVTANLGDWLLFLKQRLDPHAQKEIRVFAIAISEIFEKLFPVTMQAFYDYQLNAVTFSAQEMDLLRAILNGKTLDSTYNAILPVYWDAETRKEILSEYIPTKRERQEFWQKIKYDD